MNSVLSRRQLLGSMGAAASAAALTAAGEAPAPRFVHGVASGDPLADRLVIWTRLTMPERFDSVHGVMWEVARDGRFRKIVRKGEARTDADRDFSIKVDVEGLEPGTTYYYRFRAGRTTSPVGRGRTLPQGAVERLRFAVVSCANYPQGFFNVYRMIAREDDIDAVLHLGDYLYEYPDGVYADPQALEQGRHVSAGEMVGLADYRARHALYKTDPDLQAVHAMHAMIAIWDDHEFANDTWRDGAQNHDGGEGDWADRRAAAVKAYYEWMPVREPAPGADPLARWRSFEFGDLAQLILMETRTTGRDEQLSYAKDMVYRSLPFDFSNPDAPVAVTDPERLKALPETVLKHIPVPFDMTGDEPRPLTDYAQIRALDPKALPDGLAYLPDAERFRETVLNDPERRMIGADQEAFLKDRLNASNAPWQLIGQQLLMGRLVAPDFLDVADFSKPSFVSKQQAEYFTLLGKMGLPLNLDAWDGYPAARERLLAAFRESAASVLVLAGDSHNSWAFNLKDEAGDPAAVELATPAVSSPGFDRYLPVPREIMAKRFLAGNKALKHFEPGARGWIDLHITRAQATAHWRHVSTVLAQDFEEIDGARLMVKAGEKLLRAE